MGRDRPRPTSISAAARRGAQQSQMPFHVTSIDWQESDRLLAGHHDRVRCADRRHRRSAGAASSTASCSNRFRARASKGISCGERLRAWDVALGADRGRPGDREQLRHDHEGPGRGRGVDDRRRGPVLARLPAQGQRRRDQRRHPHVETSPRGSAARVSARRLSRRRARVRRIPHLGQVRDARSASDVCRSTAGKAYGETFDVATANLRFETHRRPPRQHRHHEEHRPGHRRRLGRVGRQLLVRRRRHANPGRVAGDARRSRARRSPGSCSSTPPAPARSKRRATTSGRGRPICSPATKASARSPARLSLRGDMLTMDFDASSRAPLGVGIGPSGADPGDGRRADAALLRHLARSVSPVLRAEDVPVHDRRRRRHHPRRRRAGRHRSPASSKRRRQAAAEAVRLPGRQRRTDPARAQSARRCEVQRFRLVGDGTRSN